MQFGRTLGVRPRPRVPLCYLAIWWIRAAIQEYVLHSNSIVKMGTTAAQKKLFFNLRQMKGRLGQHELGDLSPEAVETIAVAARQTG